MVELAGAADAEALYDLDRRNFPRADWFSRHSWSTIVGEQARNNQILTFVARRGPRIVGAIVGDFRPSRAEVSVWSIAVDENLRGSGLAVRLTAELVRLVPLDYRWVTLEARRENARARRFYERLGFRIVREVHRGYADGADAILYRVSVDDLRLALGLVPSS